MPGAGTMQVRLPWTSCKAGEDAGTVQLLAIMPILRKLNMVGERRRRRPRTRSIPLPITQRRPPRAAARVSLGVQPITHVQVVLPRRAFSDDGMCASGLDVEPPVRYPVRPSHWGTAVTSRDAALHRVNGKDERKTTSRGGITKAESRRSAVERGPGRGGGTIGMGAVGSTHEMRAADCRVEHRISSRAHATSPVGASPGPIETREADVMRGGDTANYSCRVGSFAPIRPRRGRDDGVVQWTQRERGATAVAVQLPGMWWRSDTPASQSSALAHIENGPIQNETLEPARRGRGRPTRARGRRCVQRPQPVVEQGPA